MIPEGVQRLRESANISRIRPCYNIYVTFQRHCHSVVLVTIETLSVRYYAPRLDTTLEAEKNHGDNAESTSDTY